MKGVVLPRNHTTQQEDHRSSSQHNQRSLSLCESVSLSRSSGRSPHEVEVVPDPVVAVLHEVAEADDDSHLQQMALCDSRAQYSTAQHRGAVTA